jgi:hypothetical protein
VASERRMNADDIIAGDVCGKMVGQRRGTLCSYMSKLPIASANSELRKRG